MTKQRAIIVQHERSILWLAIGVRICVLVLAIIADIVVHDYDRSANERRLPFSVRWDSVLFFDIAQNGYRFEQQYAFQPALPLAMQILSHTLFRPLAVWFSASTILTVSGLLITNISFVVAALILYRLSRHVLLDDIQAYRSAVLFCLTPCGIFMGVMYSESPFALLSFIGLHLLYTHRQRCAAALTFAIATSFRVNGIVLSGFFLYEALHTCLHHHTKTLQGAVKKYIFTWTRAIVLSAIVFVPHIIIQYFAYRKFCSSDESLYRPYCSHTLPSVYSFVQQHYWNVGLFRYWTLKQIPQFILASPVLCISVFGLYTYCSYAFRDVCTGGIMRCTSRPRVGFANRRVLCFMYYWAILSISVFLFAHVQIATRFLSATPPLYWFAALLSTT